MPEISHASYRAGHGEPLVLIHGFTATWRCWLPVLAELVPRFDVYAPTLHGHDGGPPLPAGARSEAIGDAADHVERQLDEAGIETAHLAGNSMGGALALELAKRGRARSVVGLSPGGGWDPSNAAEIQRVVRWFARNQRLAKASLPRMPVVMRRPGARRLALRDVMTRADHMPPAEAVALVRSSVRCDVVDDVFRVMRSGNAHLTGLDTITCPVLVAWGERDRILPLDRHSQRFRDEIPGVQFRVLRGVGHTPMWDDPQLIASVIADFATAAQAAVDGSGSAEQPAAVA